MTGSVDPQLGSTYSAISGVDQATGDVLRLGWTALNDDFMPVEVVLDQMQVRFEHCGRSFELDFRRSGWGIRTTQVLDQVLLVVRDVTAAVERRRSGSSSERPCMSSAPSSWIQRASAIS